ncbi:uncharacterized protein O3C94_019929 [Discoglossus pictus]
MEVTRNDRFVRKKSVARERMKVAMQTLPPRHQPSKKSMSISKQSGTRGTRGSKLNTNEGTKDRSEEKKSVHSRKKARQSNKEKESSMSKENDAPFDREVILSSRLNGGPHHSPMSAMKAAGMVIEPICDLVFYMTVLNELSLQFY